MKKKVTEFVILFFFLLTLVNAETGWVISIATLKSIHLDAAACDDRDFNDSEELPSDAEEDNTSSREIDEYDTNVVSLHQNNKDRLLNLHYTFQHLLFKEHFRELIVPPPKA